jgi:hypothetical protein
MFAIGYGIPPNGPLRAIRRSATPLAREVAAYLATRSSATGTPHAVESTVVAANATT